MMDDMAKKTLERTRGTLLRHLEDLNDEVEQNDGRIGNPMVLDGMKDAITSLDCLNGMMAADTAVTEPSKTGTVYKASDR